ncbi:MAG: hypothetical protein RLZZ543_445, partial [Bacteroidota bacterium]
MRSLLLCLSLIASCNIFAQQHPIGPVNDTPNPADATTLDTRCDSIDILHTNIYLDFSALPATTLNGNCLVNFSAKVNGISTITLDLLAMTVDSVKQEDQSIAFNHVGSKLNITLNSNLTTGDNTSVIVYYHGTPVEDASGFGGFSFSGNYAYNIGVGFDADP